MEFLFPVILLVLVGFMLLTARRQKKLQAQTQQMQDSLTIGDRVQTTSGVYGTVTGVDDGVVDLELATGYVTRWNRPRGRARRRPGRVVPGRADVDPRRGPRARRRRGHPGRPGEGLRAGALSAPGVPAPRHDGRREGDGR
jgi:preprotein translocase YajC subunit